MSPSASRSKPKFLLDENVKKELLQFLKSQGYDVISKPKGLTNGRLAAYSKSESRVLVTNDADFTDPLLFSREKIFSVVWLQVPQDNPKSLISSFSALLAGFSKLSGLEGQLIVLKENSFEAKPLPKIS